MATSDSIVHQLFCSCIVDRFFSVYLAFIVLGCLFYESRYTYSQCPKFKVFFNSDRIPKFISVIYVSCHYNQDIIFIFRHHFCPWSAVFWWLNGPDWITVYFSSLCHCYPGKFKLLVSIILYPITWLIGNLLFTLTCSCIYEVNCLDHLTEPG